MMQECKQVISLSLAAEKKEKKNMRQKRGGGCVWIHTLRSFEVILPFMEQVDNSKYVVWCGGWNGVCGRCG